MRAFTKLKIRKALAGERFTHWLPLYFGETEKYVIQSESYDQKEEQMVTKDQSVDTKERFEKHFLNSISFLANGVANKGFNHENVLEIMPKLIITHVVDMMKENRHISIVAIRRLFNFIRIFHYLASRDEKIQQMMNKKLETFLSDPDMRLKF